ncbi:barstar family protein [Paenibacillus arenosi]|uniref:Barstar family protein n=1 Tax=Paenibacillus arenosi TaxID=2774142 RepID=A0ABR9AS49_9BACL|nr:barstar family protein [Paenibacillus arenosi]MBD8496948.1 barstar family protein [Paenibacillus arenosi]
MMNISYLSISQFDETEFSVVLKEINKNTSEVFLLNGSNISNKYSFFKKVSSILPQDPPLIGDNLDAFIDSISGGFLECESQKLYILWTHVDIMAKNDPENYKLIIECFNDVVMRTAKEEKELSVFLFGSEASL